MFCRRFTSGWLTGFGVKFAWAAIRADERSEGCFHGSIEAFVLSMSVKNQRFHCKRYIVEDAAFSLPHLRRLDSAGRERGTGMYSTEGRRWALWG
ncbi:MAG: hypothetical protein KatS3mg050_4936 [Litorilinea sp.]|nr:MAG: hypothetical protein KatS3mg050_1116 [Litorilinea sp.]GIV80542.1 MAG: hypothetical protein KatS3mg050_4936 [Litorilinea sp.]